ncbi:hypothetical protein GWK47_035366 [Chionoecetes opilio]|uniref:Uncharacterized protein n=1 Tax=Chionoecetes opilio TaxID=41210 RepID=A0A8J4YNC2_CHIOP|nr:hypothetical protein GWK47_035366 [Chionoecetes opilio]
MVPKLAAGTGVLTGQAVYDAAKEWDLVDNIIGMCFDTNSQQYRTQGGRVRPHNEARQTESAPLRLPAPRARASGGCSITVCFRPVFRPRDPAVQAVCEVVAAREPGVVQTARRPRRRRRQDHRTCHALLKEKQPRDERYREMVQLTIIVLGGEEFALTKHEKRELIRFTTFIVTTYVEPWMSAHCSTSAPATDLALLKALAAYRDKEIGRASGKVMARHMWYVSEELVGLSPLRRGTVVEEKRAIVSAMQQRLGEKNPPRRADVALDAVEQRSLASFCNDQLCRPRHRPRGRSRFPQRRSGRVVGEGRLTPRLVGAPVTYGGERLCGEGRRPHQRVLRRHHARRGTATAPSAGRGAPPGVVPVREIGIGWRARWISFFDHRHQCRLVEV